MKKSCVLFSIFYFLFSVSALPILSFQHNETQVGETIFATIKTSGEFTRQIEPSDIAFLDSRKKIFLESDITFYNDIHYLYIYATRDGNFTIKINNILYKENNELKSLTIEKQFTISKPSNESQILSVKPGFIITTQTPQIKLTNKGTLQINITHNNEIITLNPLDFQKMEFQPTEAFSFFNIETYKTFSVPIIYPVANSSFESPTIQFDLKQEPELFFAELIVDTETQKTIQLFNFGDENATIIQVISNLSFIEIESPATIQPRGIQNLTITLKPKISGHFQNPINITYTQYNKTYTLQIPVSLFILPEGSNETDFEISEETCTDKNGTICTNEEICDGKAFFASDGYCCDGTCNPIEQEQKKSSSFKWLIGLVILVFLAFVGYYLYKKQKKIKPKKLEEQLKETANKFAERMQGKQSNRIRGKLSKT